MTIFEKLTLRLTVLLFGIFFGGPALLEPSGSNGGEIKLIWPPEVGEKNFNHDILQFENKKQIFA